MLGRGHGDHVLRDGICIEPVLVHALDQPQPSHDVERVRCRKGVSVYSRASNQGLAYRLIWYLYPLSV